MPRINVFLQLLFHGIYENNAGYLFQDALNGSFSKPNKPNISNEIQNLSGGRSTWLIVICPR